MIVQQARKSTQKGQPWLWLPFFLLSSVISLANGAAVSPLTEIEMHEQGDTFIGREALCIASESGHYRIMAKGKDFSLKGPKGAQLDVNVFLRAMGPSRDQTVELEPKVEVSQLPTRLSDGDCRSYRPSAELTVVVPDEAAAGAVAGYYSAKMTLRVRAD